jgi:hypothetical protein
MQGHAIPVLRAVNAVSVALVLMDLAGEGPKPLGASYPRVGGDVSNSLLTTGIVTSKGLYVRLRGQGSMSEQSPIQWTRRGNALAMHVQPGGCRDAYSGARDGALGANQREVWSMTVLSLIARQDYLEKVARTRDPIRAISEFVWNALDADAT